MCNVDKGELYTCGDGAFGELGHGNIESRLLPCRVEHLSSVCINMVACGMRHTLALSITQGTSSRTV
jgi:E3 ubiquitin-protein ligase HERC4